MLRFDDYKKIYHAFCKYHYPVDSRHFLSLLNASNLHWYYVRQYCCHFFCTLSLCNTVNWMSIISLALKYLFLLSCELGLSIPTLERVSLLYNHHLFVFSSSETHFCSRKKGSDIVLMTIMMLRKREDSLLLTLCTQNNFSRKCFLLVHMVRTAW